ncbi:MAG TPA: radical SAM protein [Candidatus Omnitrophota bacterium]|nr:radical SAM protein [Candidatus Omnitrophota bacterium]HPD85492.1 radical SAM protein [Candidatus Omnitrophota bacterium]HRZ04007.1 radical SAM protein [Candidatus Omnitrophota bacterium]
MARILLIRTRSEKYEKAYGAPPLGLLYLGAVLRQNHAHQVKILDMRADFLAVADASKEFVSFQPDIVGISGFTLEVNMLHQVAAAIKRESPGCPIVVGGPHANACSQELLDDFHINYVVLGEGEKTLPDLIEAVVLKTKDVNAVRGIVFKKDGKIVRTGPREPVSNLDELPFPGWDLIDVEKYYALPRFMPFTPDGGTPYMPIMTSRGCPYSCTYCHNILGKQFRARSAENVFAEIEALYQRYGITDFEFTDDCFNLDKKRVLAICELIIKSGVKMKLSFPNGLRGDVLDEEILGKLRDAGTRLICLAPETGSKRLQKLIKKNMDLEKLQRMISAAVKLGIHVHGFFMLGFPTETKSDLKETLRFIGRTKLHTADFFIVNLFPDTEMYRAAKAAGKNVPERFDDIDYHDTNFNISDVSNKELIAIQKKFFMAFYFDPRRIWRILFSPVIQKRFLIYYAVIFLRRVILRRRES